MFAYAAFLRGIAPSGVNMTNDKLRGVFERLGFERVASVLSSGNIVFGSPDTEVPVLERRIEQALTADLGLASRTIVRTLDELRALLGSDPFPGLAHSPTTYLTATFLKHAPATPGPVPEPPGSLTRFVRYDPDARAVLAVTDNSNPGQGSAFMTRLERLYGKDITTRTWLSVQRVAAKLES